MMGYNQNFHRLGRPKAGSPRSSEGSSSRRLDRWTEREPLQRRRNSPVDIQWGKVGLWITGYRGTQGSRKEGFGGG